MLPVDFTDRMRKMLGDEYEAFMDSLETERNKGLRINTLKVSMDKGEDAIIKAQYSLTPVPWNPSGFYYGGEDQPGKHCYHEAGLYYIQEPSAQAPVSILNPQPGDRILDLCAAPGGKSTQIAAALQGCGLLICNEINGGRAKILSENVERLGIRNALVTNETPERLADCMPGFFDKILVDAPCSGEGMFRKNEESLVEWSLANVEMCADRQDGILDRAATMLRPGGIMMYSTCTFAPAENEGSVSRFLKRHPDFRIIPIDKKAYGLAEQGDCRSDGRAQWIEDSAEGIEGTLRVWPHVVKGEGHYAALLQKDPAGLTGYEQIPARGYELGLGLKALGELKDFVEENLTGRIREDILEADRNSRNPGPDSPKLGKFGDNIYLFPPHMPALSGIKVLRPGLHLGCLKKNRFEPSHALALAMTPDEAVHCCRLSTGNETDLRVINNYINGQTFNLDGDKGWYLICIDGFSLAWGKLAAGIMKNHYPKGLRRDVSCREN